MPKSDVLTQVKDDLTLGHTRIALRRLRTLVAVDPDDLEVHRALAEVYRQTGDLVEAGRWSFLTEDTRREELAAFERGHPDPWLRLQLIRWTGDPILLPDDGARARLMALREAAEGSDPPARWPEVATEQAPRTSTVPCLFVSVSLVALGVLAVSGLLRAVGILLP